MVANEDGARERRVPKTHSMGSRKFKRKNGQHCSSRRVVQTDIKRRCTFQEGPINQIQSMKRSSKIRTRKRSTGLGNTKTGLTSLGADSGNGGGRRRLIKMN